MMGPIPEEAQAAMGETKHGQVRVCVRACVQRSTFLLPIIPGLRGCVANLRVNRRSKSSRMFGASLRVSPFFANMGTKWPQTLSATHSTSTCRLLSKFQCLQILGTSKGSWFAQGMHRVGYRVWKCSWPDFVGVQPWGGPHPSSSVMNTCAPLISTWGSRPPPGQGYIVAIFPQGKAEEALQLVAHATEQQ
eukprot:262794-Pelagomonas_calceolata.AAC.1